MASQINLQYGKQEEQKIGDRLQETDVGEVSNSHFTERI